MLARLEGKLLGTASHGRVSTWVVAAGGRRIAVAWPRTFHARLHPLEVLDDHNRVVARGGRSVAIGGGFMPPSASPDRDAAAVFVTWGVANSGRHP